MASFTRVRAFLGVTAAAAGACALAIPGQASASPKPQVPSTIYYAVTNGQSDKYLYYAPAAREFEVYGGAYTTLYVTVGAGQEYQDPDANYYCVTYHTTNYLDEVPCTGVSSQLWKSTLQSDGSWIVKNEYTGSGKCMTQGPVIQDPVGMQPCNDELKQEWFWTGVIISGPNH
jgi:hypothetical protein